MQSYSPRLRGSLPVGAARRFSGFQIPPSLRRRWASMIRATPPLSVSRYPTPSGPARGAAGAELAPTALKIWPVVIKLPEIKHGWHLRFGLLTVGESEKYGIGAQPRRGADHLTDALHYSVRRGNPSRPHTDSPPQGRSCLSGISCRISAMRHVASHAALRLGNTLIGSTSGFGLGPEIARA